MAARLDRRESVAHPGRLPHPPGFTGGGTGALPGGGVAGPGSSSRATRCTGEGLTYLDLGGGFAVPLAPGEPRFPFGAFGPALELRLGGLEWDLILEPGRFLLGEAGLFLTRVIRVKESRERRFVVVDGGDE